MREVLVGPRLVARAVTEVLAPWVWVLAMSLVVGWHATRDVVATAVWGLVLGVAGAVLPMAVIVHGARRGRWHGRHVTNREGRWVPLLTCTGSVALGTAVLLLGGAPRQVVALAVAMVVSLVVTICVTFAFPVTGGRGWKVSLHSAVAAGAVVVLVVDHGPAPLWLAPAVALVAWSRVVLGDHTAAQVVGGGALGALGGLVYWAAL